MFPVRPHPYVLFTLACLSIAALMLLSDFSPPPAEDLASVDTDGSEISCLVVSSRTTEKGHVLNLTDTSGHFAEAFCSFEVAADPPPDGSMVRVVVEPSADDPSFLFVQKLEVVQGPSGKD